MALRPGQQVFRPAALPARICPRLQRPLHTKSPRHLQVTCSLLDPWATLGVPKTANEKEVKKAHRKLVLQHHPDVKGGEDLVAHARFMRIQEAYELIMGKRHGKDTDNQPADKSGWQFHDWYWKFSMKRRKSSSPFGAAIADDESAPGALRQQWQAQMAGLKQKAAAKSSRQQGRRRTAGPPSAGGDGAMAAMATAASKGPSGSAAGRKCVWRSMTKNARNADKVAAQAVAAQAHGGSRRTAVPSGAEQQQPPPQQQADPTAAAAASQAAAAAEVPPLHHAAVQQQPEQERLQHAQQHRSTDEHSSSSSHVERLRQVLEHAATLVQPAGEDDHAAHRQVQTHSQQAKMRPEPAGHRHMRGHMSLEQLTALLTGRRPPGAPDGTSSAIPAEKHLHEHFEASMRCHQAAVEQPAAACGAPVFESTVEEDRQQQGHKQYSQYCGTSHSAKFANRDEVEGRLSSQLAGLKRRAAMKQMESRC